MVAGVQENLNPYVFQLLGMGFFRCKEGVMWKVGYAFQQRHSKLFQCPRQREGGNMLTTEEVGEQRVVESYLLGLSHLSGSYYFCNCCS